MTEVFMSTDVADSLAIKIKQQLRTHEGLRLRPYLCTEGKLTIGYGRNLEDNGISKEEAEYLLDNDVSRVTKALAKRPVFQKLNPIRQMILVNMAFQMGVEGVFGFKKMWLALEAGDHIKAALEMLDSHWAGQTPVRARELAELMRKGW